MTTRLPSELPLYSGANFDILNPTQDEIGIYDIAHALANICRFCGHSQQFYSVAQHSVGVSKIVPDEDALAGLMHDATEALIGDVTTPLKRMLPDYQLIEQKLERALFDQFGFGELPDTVRHADLVMLATEKRDLMPHHLDIWPALKGIDPLPVRISPLRPTQAKELFINRYLELRT